MLSLVLALLLLSLFPLLPALLLLALALVLPLALVLVVGILLCAAARLSLPSRWRVLLVPVTVLAILALGLEGPELVLLLLTPLLPLALVFLVPGDGALVSSHSIPTHSILLGAETADAVVPSNAADTAGVHTLDVPVLLVLDRDLSRAVVLSPGRILVACSFCGGLVPRKILDRCVLAGNSYVLFGFSRPRSGGGPACLAPLSDAPAGTAAAVLWN